MSLQGPEGHDFLAVSVATGRDFLALFFLAWVIVKKNLWLAGKLFLYRQRDFMSLIRELSDGKIKQKGFFHNAHFFVILFGSTIYPLVS